ncbi:importin-11 [Lethenteron reissneri]|uniref:importin-11 n=1 Tax=Lethenteron reissneri TaxID=7753 RepID=UPI002AB66AF2|nr:importin-11 [Lethenteron reissneri]
MELASASVVVIQTLTRATNQDASVLKPAEEQLRQWEIQPGFYSVLLNIFMDHSLDVHVRWLAALYFKNGIDRYWRRLAPNSLSEEEKSSLRAGLIANFNEPVNQVATQIAVLIAKVARLDCPRQWPELIPVLLEGVRTQAMLPQHRALLTFYHVTKVLASKRLAVDRRLFQELASGIYGFCCSLWTHHTESFLQQVVASDHDATAHSLERTLLSLKVLRKLTVHGFAEPHGHAEVMAFLNAVFERMQQYLNCLRTITAGHPCREKLEKAVILCTKVLLDFLEQHPFSFVPFVSRSLELAVGSVFAQAEGRPAFERFTVQCMSLIKMIVKNDSYRPSKNPEDSKPQTMEAYRVKSAFFNYQTLTEICRRLVSHYFLLTPEDLAMWDEDPEGFAIEESGGDSWKYSLRPCTEVLFLDIFHEYSETLTPVLLEMLHALQVPTSHEDSVGLFIKDAVYNAVGLAAYELFDTVDFDEWFRNQLVVELQVKDSRYRLIRRRVIWLVGQWVAVKFKQELRPVLYQALLSLLQDADLVVRLAAATTLKLSVDDFDFKTEQFTPYLESIFSLLFQLLQSVSDCDSKMHVLNVTSCVIERVGSQIRPHSGSLVQYLPVLWKQSEEHNMLRCAILTTLINLVQGLGADSVGLYPFLLPVIQLSTDISKPPHVYLLEDGLELWLMTLENCPAVTAELLHIFHNMPAILELGSENMQMCLQIVRAYAYLAPVEFLESYGATLCKAFCDLQADITTEGQVHILKIIENILKVHPVAGPQIFHPLLPSIFKGILDGERYPVVMATYLGIFGRIILQNPAYFSGLLGQIGMELGQEPDQLLGSLVDMWVDRMDNITQPGRRKLSALALASLLPTDNSIVQDRFCGLVNVCAEALHDIMMEDPDGGAYRDRLIMAVEEVHFGEELEQPTEQDKRKKLLAMKDPVHSTSLQQYVYDKLKAQQDFMGPQAFQVLMETVDPELTTQLQEFMSSL